MTREKQDGEWPLKPTSDNPVDRLRWETINNPDGKFAKYADISNMAIFLAVSIGMALAIIALGVRFALWILGVDL